MANLPASQVRLQVAIGSGVQPLIETAAKFRIAGFREFPYLYAGSMEYERAYFAGFADEPRAVLILAHQGEELVAVSTAMPLTAKSSILADMPTVMQVGGFDPAEIFYYAETIVANTVRGQGIGQLIYAERERLAREWGYKKVCFAAVERAPDHPQRPPDYAGNSVFWSKQGFVRTGLTITYDWPTILPDGSTREMQHELAVWVKDLD